MGNQAGQFAEKFSRKFSFVEYQPESRFGPIKVYRKQEPVFDYVMLVDRHLNEDDLPSAKEQLNCIHNSFKQPTPPLLLKLFGYEIIAPSLGVIQNCNQKCRIRVYLEFCNFTLKDLIEHRAAHDYGFSLEEIMYVLNGLMRVYHFFLRINMSYLCARTDCIFLGIDGSLKLSPIEILSTSQTEEETSCQVSHSCRPNPIRKKYKMNQNLLVYEIKKLVSEMSHCCLKCSQNSVHCSQTPAIFQFQSQIQNCTSVDQIEKLLFDSALESLDITPKFLQKVEKIETEKNDLDSSIVQRVNKNSPVFTQTSKASKQNTKLSVKSIVNDMKSQRSFSHQTEQILK